MLDHLRGYRASPGSGSLVAADVPRALFHARRSALLPFRGPSYTEGSGDDEDHESCNHS